MALIGPQIYYFDYLRSPLPFKSDKNSYDLNKSYYLVKLKPHVLKVELDYYFLLVINLYGYFGVVEDLVEYSVLDEFSLQIIF